MVDKPFLWQIPEISDKLFMKTVSWINVFTYTYISCDFICRILGCTPCSLTFSNQCLHNSFKNSRQKCKKKLDFMPWANLNDGKPFYFFLPLCHNCTSGPSLWCICWLYDSACCWKCQGSLRYSLSLAILIIVGEVPPFWTNISLFQN